jgi:hypothetical protein
MIGSTRFVKLLTAILLSLCALPQIASAINQCNPNGGVVYSTQNLGLITSSPYTACPYGDPQVSPRCTTLTFSTPGPFSIPVGFSYQPTCPGEVYQVTFTGTFAQPITAQPKYAIVGVYYAPPCSSGNINSVVYGNADQVKVDNSLTNEFTQSDSVSLSGSYSFEADYVPITIGGSTSYGWSSSTITGTDVAVTTSNSENYTIDGCHGSDGINHVYDIIWIWLNPVLPYYIPPSTSAQQQIIVLGTGSDGRDPVTSQTHAPDVVALSVVQMQSLIAVLNAVPAQTPTPTNTGIDQDTLNELQRTWDTTWATNSGGESGPGLVVADYQDILSADPFVSNPSFNPASSTRYALVNSAYILYGATATPTEYSYTGQATQATAQTNGTDDQHYVSVEVSVQLGSGATPGQSKLDYQGKWLWDTKSQSTTTNTATQTATFNVWTPSASYAGPDQLAVYWDTDYQTFVFYPL